MADGRKDHVTAYAQVLLDEMQSRMGSLKAVLSAGVVALSKMTPEQQQDMCEEAYSVEPEKRTRQFPEKVRLLIRNEVLDVLNSPEWADGVADELAKRRAGRSRTRDRRPKRHPKSG